jgi:hypothetical protein
MNHTIAIIRKKSIGTNGLGLRRSGRRIISGGRKERAVVVTLSMKGAGLALFTVADEGEAVQVASVGAPEHASETDPEKPASGFTCRLKVATWPALTVMDADAPLATLNEKSGVVTVNTAVFEATPP